MYCLEESFRQGNRNHAVCCQLARMSQKRISVPQKRTRRVSGQPIICGNRYDLYQNRCCALVAIQARRRCRSRSRREVITRCTCEDLAAQ